jgi:hypothetical protein
MSVFQFGFGFHSYTIPSVSASVLDSTKPKKPNNQNLPYLLSLAAHAGHYPAAHTTP